MSTMKAINYAFNRFVLRRRYLTAQAGGLTFRVRAEDVVGRHIYKYGQHDREMSRYLRSTVKPDDGDLLIDIGANIGWYSLMFSQACRDVDARVLCFEPDPQNFDVLQHNVATNVTGNTVVLKPLALSDNANGATLHLFSDRNRGRHSLLPLHDGDTVEIATARLDDVIAAEPDLAARSPALIKIDIEGFELIALRGGAATLSRCPIVVLEYSPDFMRRGELEPVALLDLMYDAGFVPHALHDDQTVLMQRDQLLNDDTQVDLIWRRASSN